MPTFQKPFCGNFLQVDIMNVLFVQLRIILFSKSIRGLGGFRETHSNPPCFEGVEQVRMLYMDSIVDM